MAYARQGPKALAFCNQKGGVGKTASAVNTAAAFAKSGHKTLLVDCDYQGNASDYFRLKLQAISNRMTLFDGIRLEKDIEDCILSTEFENLDLIASSLELSKWEKHGYKHNKISRWFSSKFVETNYDFIVFDTRPQLGSLFDNVLAYVHWYLVPMFAEPDALSGLKIILHELAEIQEAYNDDLRCAGLLITKFNKKNKTHCTFYDLIKSVSESLELNFLGAINQSDAISGSVNKYTPLPYYLEGRKNLPVRQSYLDLGKTLTETMVYKQGRIPKVPELPDEYVLHSMEQLGGEDLYE